LRLAPESAGKNVELTPTDDDLFWAHFSEGSQMNLLQAGLIVSGTAAAWSGGLAARMSEEGKAGIKQYAGWLTEGYLRPQNQTNLDQAS
jgi:hypothetical protein